MEAKIITHVRNLVRDISLEVELHIIEDISDYRRPRLSVILTIDCTVIVCLNMIVAQEIAIKIIKKKLRLIGLYSKIGCNNQHKGNFK